MLIKAETWIIETFVEGSRPTIKRVKRWIANDIVNGILIDSRAYIDNDNPFDVSVKKIGDSAEQFERKALNRCEFW